MCVGIMPSSGRCLTMCELVLWVDSNSEWADMARNKKIPLLPLCEEHLIMVGQAHVKAQGYPERPVCMTCQKVATFFVANSWTVLPLCEKHAIELGGLMAADIKRKPFQLTYTCSCHPDAIIKDYDNLMDVMMTVDGFEDMISGHGTLVVTTVDSHGQTLQLYPL